MFCALNGATENPFSTKILHNAVTSVVLPALDAVP
jgi:hypothetical protein